MKIKFSHERESKRYWRHSCVSLPSLQGGLNEEIANMFYGRGYGTQGK